MLSVHDVVEYLRHLSAIYPIQLTDFPREKLGFYQNENESETNKNTVGDLFHYFRRSTIIDDTLDEPEFGIDETDNAIFITKLVRFGEIVPRSILNLEPIFQEYAHRFASANITETNLRFDEDETRVSSVNFPIFFLGFHHIENGIGDIVEQMSNNPEYDEILDQFWGENPLDAVLQIISQDDQGSKIIVEIVHYEYIIGE